MPGGGPNPNPPIRTTGFWIFKKKFCTQCEQQLDKSWDACPFCAQIAQQAAQAPAKLQKMKVPAAPVLSIEETVKHPHLRARGTVRTVEDRIAGKFDIPGMPLKFSEFPEDLPLQAATLGQHNREVLHDLLGRSDEEIRALREANVLVEGEC